MISPRRLVNTLGGLLVLRRVFFTPFFMVTKSCTKILILPKIFQTAKSCTKSSQDFQMAGNMLSWQNLSPRFSNGGCHENLDSGRKSIAPLLSLGDKQKTLETKNGHGHYDAAIAKTAAAVTYVQSLSQEVGSGDEGLGLFGFDLSSAETDLIVQAYRVRRSTSRYGLSHRDQSRRDVWMGVITPHFRDRCITPSWMTALGHFLSTPSPSPLPERPV